MSAIIRNRRVTSGEHGQHMTRYVAVVGAPHQRAMVKTTTRTSRPINLRTLPLLAVTTLIASVSLWWAAFGLYRYRRESSLGAETFRTSRFCDADGTCHERPDAPSPRTVFSARSREQYDRWWRVEAEQRERARAYADARRAKMARARTTSGATSITTRPLVLLGDSITEAWMGTSYGWSVKRAQGAPEVLRDRLSAAAGLDPLVLAVSGDQTQHLLYRLRHGTLLRPYASDPEAVFVVLIGTNNLGAGELPGPTADGVLAVTEELLRRVKGSVLIMSLLPRGDGAAKLRELCPPRCADAETETPFTSFDPAVKKVNAAVAAGVERLRETYGGGSDDDDDDDRRVVETLDCGARFWDELNERVRPDLMPDLLHPNAKGYAILANCLRKRLDVVDDGAPRENAAAEDDEMIGRVGGARLARRPKRRKPT